MRQDRGRGDRPSPNVIKLREWLAHFVTGRHHLEDLVVERVVPAANASKQARISAECFDRTINFANDEGRNNNPGGSVALAADGDRGSDAAVPGAMSAPIVDIEEADVSTACGATAVKTAISPARGSQSDALPTQIFAKANEQLQRYGVVDTAGNLAE